MSAALDWNDHKDWCDLRRPEYTGECTCTLDDGFGNMWQKCDHDDCALEIVRPGKVQCFRCDYSPAIDTNNAGR